MIASYRSAYSRRLLLVTASALLFVAGCGTSGSGGAPKASGTVLATANPAWPQSVATPPLKAGFTADGLAALDARMSQSVANGDVAGMVTLLVRHGEVAQFKTYGVQAGDPKTGPAMTKDSVFRIYSMSKPLVGVAMMQLFEEGKWKLDDPVSKYIPEFGHLKRLNWKDGKVELDKQGEPIVVDASRSPTMRELMTHTAGLAYGLSGTSRSDPNYIPSNGQYVEQNVLGSPDLNEMMKKIERIPLVYDPGTRWSYSTAVDVQGYLVEKLSGQKFGDYLEQHVFAPLGMRDTSFYVHPEQKPRFTDVYHWEGGKLVINPDAPGRALFTDPKRLQSGGSGLVSTTHDYARFCEMMLNKGQLAGHRILKPETVALMTQNHIGSLHINSDGTGGNGQPNVGFGLDVAVYEDAASAGQPYAKGSYYWTGFAGTWFWIDPVNDLFFIGMIQRQGPARPSGLNFRKVSADLVYAALAPDASGNGGKASGEAH